MSIWIRKPHPWQTAGAAAQQGEARVRAGTTGETRIARKQGTMRESGSGEDFLLSPGLTFLQNLKDAKSERDMYRKKSQETDRLRDKNLTLEAVVPINCIPPPHLRWSGNRFAALKAAKCLSSHRNVEEESPTCKELDHD
eukprot:762760-Hanusia_phi.AAC.14